mgnify:CR=1 FL=1
MNGDFEETLDRLFPLSREPRRHKSLTCETTSGRHGVPNVDGFCNWCGQKIATKAGPFVPSNVPSEADASYGYMYDPDFGTSNWNRYR